MGCVATLPVTWSTRMKIALDAAKILAFLHDEAEPQVIFRDFKTSKILLDAVRSKSCGDIPFSFFIMLFDFFVTCLF